MIIKNRLPSGILTALLSLTGASSAWSPPSGFGFGFRFFFFGVVTVASSLPSPSAPLIFLPAGVADLARRRGVGLSPSPVALPFSTVSTGFFSFSFYELAGICRRSPHTYCDTEKESMEPPFTIASLEPPPPLHTHTRSALYRGSVTVRLVYRICKYKQSAQRRGTD